MPAVLEEALRAACEGVAGITPAQFRALPSPEDVEHIAGGDIPVETLRAYAASMAEGGRSDRLALLGDPAHPPPGPKAPPGAYTDDRRPWPGFRDLSPGGIYWAAEEIGAWPGLPAPGRPAEAVRSLSPEAPGAVAL